MAAWPWKRRTPKSNRARRVGDLPTIDRDRIGFLIRVEEGMPHLDWGAAQIMIEKECGDDEIAGCHLSRAIMAAWLDELRDAMPTDMRRWRHKTIEGLAPLEGSIAPRVSKTADRAVTMIGDALAPIRGRLADNPIPPIAVIVPATIDEYYSFISAYYSEGEFSSSGGIYLRESDENCNTLVIAGFHIESVEIVVAHELTHHALVPQTTMGRLGPGLPLWAEEGLTQMMEERVAGVTTFRLDQEMKSRHFELWSEIGLDGFLSGDTFGSPIGDEQELSYNLAEAMTRALLSSRPKQFFAFARDCVVAGSDPIEAAETHLGDDPHTLFAQFVGL